MIQPLAVGVQTSRSAANATADAVAALGEEVKREQAATASAVAAMEVDVRRVVTKVENIEEEVSATKKFLEKTNTRVERVEGAIQEHAKKIQQMDFYD